MTPPVRPPRRRAVASPVRTRSLNHPGPGWTVEQVARGYRLAQVARLTGFHPDHLRAAACAAGVVARDGA